MLGMSSRHLILLYAFERLLIANCSIVKVSALTLAVSPLVNPVTSAAGSAPATVPTMISPAVSGRVLPL
jgi:uncharacterized membrane protein